MNNKILPEQLKNLFLQGAPLIDVRAPVEFEQGRLPGAVNLPILNNDERALIGTTYREQGQEAAVSLGYQVVSGSVKESRIHAWKHYIDKHPDAVLYCFRGGKRSQITQQWLKEVGVDRPLIEGGYKLARHFLFDAIEDFTRRHPMLVVSGPTGSGKTWFLKEASPYCPVIDLEGLAEHRGSAFGATKVPQPTQIDFENSLAVELLKVESRGVGIRGPLVEDESRMIGKVYQPASFFDKLRQSEVIWIDEPLHIRVDNIYKDYVLDTAIGLVLTLVSRCADEERILIKQALEVFQRYRKSVESISKKLGGLRTQELMADLDTCEQEFLQKRDVVGNKVWIEKLLRYYYDPLYLGSLERRQVKAVFRGTRVEALQFIKNF